MPDIKKIATRRSYGEALVKLGSEFENVVVFDCDLSAATMTNLFKKEYPDRHFNCGIAESNMTSVAAGLSTCGFVPFVSTFAMFAAGRAYEQVRNSIGYPHLNVKIGATHGGISVGEDGASHQCNEDFALMRTIPGMTIICPSDDIEARQVVRAAYLHKGPVYIRFSRAASVVFHSEDYKFQIGKAETLKDGNDLTIIATGLPVYDSLEAAKVLEKEGVSVRVINMPTIKPLNVEAVIKAAKETKKILTIEEHSIIGGLGESVAGVVSEFAPCKVLRHGIPDVFGHSGSADALLGDFGLTVEGIAAKARELIL
jgi:transketolase